MRRVRLFFSRALRAVRALVRDGRIPRPLRFLAAASLLPVPGPFDEAALLLLLVVLALFYRTPLKDAWQTAEPS